MRRNLPNNDDWIVFPYALGVLGLLALGIMLIMTGCAMGQEVSVHTSVHSGKPRIATQSAVKAIIGEAEGEGYQGMLAVACAIRNRGSLHGVYGIHSFRVTQHKYNQHTYSMAVKAWAESAKKDITNGATGWGNEADVAKFRHSAWFPSVYFTAHIGRQWFYTTE